MTASTPSPSNVLEAVDRLAPPGTPLTTPEVADEFDCTARTIYNRLHTLVDNEDLLTKKVGAKGRVWWRSPSRLEPNEGIEPEAVHTESGGFERAGKDSKDTDAFATEATFRRLFKHVPGGRYLIVEPETYEIVAVNEAYLDATMTERAEILDKTLFEVFPADPEDTDPEGVPGLRRSLERVKSTGETDVMPVTYYPIPDRGSGDGGFEDRWWSPTNSPVFDDAGEIEYIIHRVEDVTSVVRQLQADGEDELLSRLDTRDSHLAADVMLRGQGLHRAKEQVHERLRESEQRYRALFESIDDGFCVIEKIDSDSNEPIDFRYVEANSAFKRHTGVGDVIGERIRDAFPGESEEVYELYNRILQTGESVQFKYELDTHDRFLELSAFKLEHKERQLGVLFKDITERKETERELARTRDLLAKTERIADVGGWELDPETRDIHWTDHLFNLMGVSGDEAPSLEEIYSVYHEDDRPAVKNAIDTALESGEPYNMEVRYRPMGDDELRWMKLQGQPEIVGGEATTLRGAVQDITERKCREEELRERAELDSFRVDLTDAIHSLSDPVEIQHQAAQIIGQHLDVSHAHYADVRLDDRVSVVNADYYRNGVTSVVGEHHFEDYGPWMLDALQAGETIVVNDIEADPMFDEENQETHDRVDIRSLVVAPLHRNGRLTGFFTVDQRMPREWTDMEVEMVEETAQRTWDAVERARAEEALRESEEHLADELKATRELQEISTELIQEDDIESISDRVIDAAVELVDADFASVLLYDSDRNDLELVAHRGLNATAESSWKHVNPTGKSSCARALRRGERVVVPDVETCEFMAGSEDQETYLQTGIRAVQTTPLVSRNGDVLGMFSTHWETSHDPSERDLSRLDILARQVADLVERRQTMGRLRQSEEKFSAVANLVPSLLWSNDPDGATTWYNQQWLDYTGQTMDEALGDGWLEVIHPADREQSLTNLRTALDEGEPLRREHRIRRHDGEYRWFLSLVNPVEDDDGTIRRWFGTAIDIHDERALAASLDRLNTASHALMKAAPEEIRDNAAGLIQRVLGVQDTVLWRYDRTTGDLQVSDKHGSDEPVGYPDDLSERVWQVFIRNDIEVDNNLPRSEGSSGETPLRSTLLLPLGRHGVVCAGSLRPDTFDERTVELAQTAAATLETAWDRAEGKQRLERQNDELQRLDRLNALIRSINHALVGAETRDEIDRTVCEQLADSPFYEFAWIGEPDPVSEEITPRVWAGVDSAYLEALSLSTTENGTQPNQEQDPIAAAARTRELQVVEDIATDARVASWREATLERGARSCLSVPLVYDESLYGVLTVYAAQPQSDDQDHGVLAEFGEGIAHAVDAVERSETLQTNHIVEVTLRMQDPNTPLCRLAREANCTIEFDGLVHDPTSDSAVFFTASGVPADVVCTAGEQIYSIKELLVLSEQGDRTLFRAELSGPSLPSLITEQDAVIQTLTITEERVTAVVDVARTAAVRPFIEEMRESVAEVDLLTRRAQNRSPKTRSTFRAVCEDRLTSKQLAILQTAYFSGFFESPRVRTGQEIAGLLNVSQPTFTTHLRAAERGLCDILFAQQEVSSSS